MDIVSFIVTCAAIYGILVRTPGLIGEAMAEREYASRGEESPAAKARRKKLEAAGIAPYDRGGPMRRYLGNVWRDYWADRAEQRAADQADAKADQARSWWQRLQDRIDEDMVRRVDGWRTGDPESPQPKANEQEPEPPPSDSKSKGPKPNAGEPIFTVIHDDEPGSHTNQKRPHTTPPDDNVEQRRPPIRVEATVGYPTNPARDQTMVPSVVAGPTPIAIEGAPTMTTVARQHVTGVVSGAMEARAIQRAIELAAEEYAARMTIIRARIHALGEQSLTTVQLASYSRVVTSTAAAAEAAAAAQSAVTSCVTEVAPLMGYVAAQFNRINS